MSENDIVDSTMSYYIPGIHLCVRETINLLFIHTVATLYIYTSILLSRQKPFFFDLVYANYTGFYIINIIDCYTLSYYHTLFSCSSWFCESGKQPVVEGLTESCTMILEIMLFLASKYQFQNLCCPQWSCFLWFFVVVLLSSQSQLLQYTSERQLILHLMDLQLPGFRCWYTLFWSCWNNLLILYCSVVSSYLWILLALACILCFSSSKTTSNPFFLTLY